MSSKRPSTKRHPIDKAARSVKEKLTSLFDLSRPPSKPSSRYIDEGSSSDNQIIMIDAAGTSPLVDANGFVRCPECDTRVNCGTASLANLAQHQGKGPCQKAKAKRDKDTKKKGNIEETNAVPSMVTHSMPIQSQMLAATSRPIILTAPASPSLETTAIAGPVFNSVLGKLCHLIDQLPDSIPEATAYNKLTVFGSNPAVYDDTSLDSDDLWEKSLNGLLKSDDMENLIRRGRNRLDGLTNFVKHFVVKWGVNEALFEGKLLHLLNKLEEIVKLAPVKEATTLPPPEVVKLITICASGDPKLSNEEPKVVNVVDILKPMKMSAKLCKGHVLTFPDGKSPHSCYPFALHDTLVLPWDYRVHNSVMTIFARSCTSQPGGMFELCHACWSLAKNANLEGIIERIQHSVHKNANFAYHSFSGLLDLLQKKNQQINFHRFHGLNQAKKLLSKATALSHQKQLLMVITSGKKGVHGLLSLFFAAADGIYHPKSFTEEERMKSMLAWRLGGNCIAEINHLPPIIPSHEQPTTKQVRENVNATLKGILNEMHTTKKRIHWDPKTNYFLGVCREHAHTMSMEFELFRFIDDGKVHYAGEVTVGALGILSKDNHIYPGHPVLVSGDCKKETGAQHAHVIQTVIDGVDSVHEETKLCITSISSDGEARRGAAFINLTFKCKLLSQSPIFSLLQPLKFLDLHVGDDDITCDKDYKHIFKQFRNLFVRERGVVVMGRRIMPNIMMTHFKSEGLSADHIQSLFNPEDAQDVKMAFDMLKDIWNLPRLHAQESSKTPGFLQTREALWILGKLLFHMIFPYLCVNLSLSEQIEHLSAAAYLALALFKCAGKDFIPTNLYIDLMLMIKNVLFSVAKAKVDDPDGEFWIILLRTDWLEERFGTTEVSNILAKYPHWDRSPQRLKLPSLSRESKEIPDRADHIKPASWRGDVKVKDVSVQTSWNCRQHLVEQECDTIKSILQELNNSEDIDILSPSGTLLFDTPLAEDDVDESLEVPTAERPVGESSNDILESDASKCVEVEDALDELRSLLEEVQEFDKEITFRGSTDHLRCFQDVEWHLKSKDLNDELPPLSKDMEALFALDPIASLGRCENQFWLCIDLNHIIGEVTGIKIDGQSVPYVNIDMLGEDTVTVSFQVLGLCPATSDDDPENWHDWRTYAIDEQSFTVPGSLV
ncbi:hypothetical protein BYT27DRAFT_7230107 [Phlegmacium glaucopus]|nr:hypothetical protein BYT27DRAFT_7230107 [Phlegmacium glaucopus]